MYVLFKMFGALSKDTCRDICKYFGADPPERQSKFILQFIIYFTIYLLYTAPEGDVCRAIF